MSDFEEDLTFDGSNGGVKCASFVRYIRRKTLANGTQRDDQLVADTAASCMDGPALRWFEDQDQDIQDSWRLLRRALLQRWPEEEEAATGSSMPAAYVPAPAPAANPVNRTGFTPAAAPPLPVGINSSRQRVNGKIRVVSEDDGSLLGYLSGNPNELGLYVVSKNAKDAQIVGFTPSSKLTDLYLDTSPAMLGVTFDGVYGKTPEALLDHLYQRSVAWGGLAKITRTSGRSTAPGTSSTWYDGVSISSLWHILLDGEAVLFCEVLPLTFVRLEIAVGGVTGAVTITNNQEEQVKGNPQWVGKKGRFILQQI